MIFHWAAAWEGLRLRLVLPAVFDPWQLFCEAQKSAEFASQPTECANFSPLLADKRSIMSQPKCLRWCSMQGGAHMSGIKMVVSAFPCKLREKKQMLRNDVLRNICVKKRHIATLGSELTPTVAEE